MLHFSELEMTIRHAIVKDIPVLSALIDASVRALQANDYTPAQIDRALATVFGVDTQLIADKTYFVVEADGAIVACGGWSRRRTLYGSDVCEGREDTLLNRAEDAAKIRAFFVHPEWARRGIGTMLLEACEKAAAAEGFTRFEMGSTLTGVALYRARGYVAIESLGVAMADGMELPIVRMEKTLRDRRGSD